MGNEENKLVLTKKQQIEKAKMIREMQKDIKNLENCIKHARYTNIKLSVLKIIKMFLRFNQLIAPYVVAGGITFGAFSLFGKTPFINDDVKRKLSVQKTIDNKGSITYEKQNEAYNAVDEITYIGKWTSSGNGYYQREVKKYHLLNIDHDVIEEIINDNLCNELDDILKNPISQKMELKNNLSEEEINSEPYLQAVLYDDESDEFIIAKETVDENTKSTVFWIMATIIIIYIGPHQYRMANDKFNYSKSIEQIRDEYQPIDVDEYTKRLEIRRDNYHRLMR